MHRSRRAKSVMILTAATVFAVILPAVPATAQQTNPCTEGMKKVCRDITPGGGRLLRCYEERKDQMSSACVGWVELLKANADGLKAACSKEIASSCNFEKGDPLEMLDCIQSNYVSLSDGCRAKLNDFQGKYPKPIR